MKIKTNIRSGTEAALQEGKKGLNAVNVKLA